MEKRALLAFVLSVAILTIWSYWFVPQNQQPVPKEEPPSAHQPQAAPKPPAPEPPPQALPQTSAGVPSVSPGGEDELVLEVETPLYTARLSSLGALLESWQLKRYRESLAADAPATELARPSSAGKPLELVLEDSSFAGINRAAFRFDKSRIEIKDGSGQATLQAALSLPDGSRILKEFTFYGDRYAVDLKISACDAQGRGLAERLGLALVYPASQVSSSSASFVGPVAFTAHGLEELGDLAKHAGKPMEVRWGGFAQHYFVSAVAPQSPGRHDLILEQRNGNVRMTIWQGASSPGACEHPFRIYLGPKSIEDLKLAGEDLDRALHLGFFDVIARPLLLAMKFINDYTHNYGIAIIVLTIVIKLLFWPLTHKSYASMKEMQRIQPRIKQLRERFKNDREQLNREMMLLYKTHKVNPLGGCLPMVLQIPVFFALYKALLDSIELRHAPFIFWVKDLSAPDYLVRFPAGVSLFGIEGIGPLPILMGASMVIQQKMTPTTGDPTQAKVMMLMPIFFTFLFISFPSGLVLYWLINNVLSIVQQIYINSRVE
jgi:YidC/Oxa1 family membrane protein insertase